MYQFRKVSENRLLLGRPASIERLGLASLLTGLALIGAPLTGEFTDSIPFLLIAGFGLIALGLRFCFLYERITITRNDHDILIDGYWFRQAIRIPRRELLAVHLYNHNLLGQNWSRYELQLFCRHRKIIGVYESCTELFTLDDVFAVARFLGVRFAEDSDLAWARRFAGHLWRSFWGKEPPPAERTFRWRRRRRRAQGSEPAQRPIPLPFVACRPRSKT